MHRRFVHTAERRCRLETPAGIRVIEEIGQYWKGTSAMPAQCTDHLIEHLVGGEEALERGVPTILEERPAGRSGVSVEPLTQRTNHVLARSVEFNVAIALQGHEFGVDLPPQH
jgi:hypothetical protein